MRKPKVKTRSLLVCFALVLIFSASVSAKPLHHYVFFGMDREKIKDTKSFLDNKQFEGAQVAYFWRQLEPGKDEYDFSLIREDLQLLTAHHKKLWIQLQDVSFSERWVPVPRYLTRDPQYHGGADRQYSNPGNNPQTPAGWTTRRWDRSVQERLHKLFVALGKEFDGRIEGINLAETSIVFDRELLPEGFTYEGYRDAIVANLLALKRAFPKSIVLQYANFMPGEWQNSKGFLKAVYQAARSSRSGVGGPDLFPYKPGQMNNSYELIRAAAGKVPVGIAVQDGNYEHVNPRTGKRITIVEQIEFAREYLRADYIFWCTEEPYFSNDVVTFLTSRK